MKYLHRRLGVYLLAAISFVWLDLWRNALIALILGVLDATLMFLGKWLKIGQDDRDQGGIG